MVGAFYFSSNIKFNIFRRFDFIYSRSMSSKRRQVEFGSMSIEDVNVAKAGVNLDDGDSRWVRKPHNLNIKYL